MKKACLVLFICILVGGTFYFIPNVHATFSDITSKHENFDAVEYVKEEGIVQGYYDGTYRQDSVISRGEFTKIIIGSNYSTSEIEKCTSSALFPDVGSSNVFKTWICVAKTNGIINGYEDGLYRSKNNISFIEAAKIISNTFGYQTEKNDTWYVPYINKLAEKKTIPTSISNYQKNITRGEMAEMIYRLKNGITNKLSLDYSMLADSEWTHYEDGDLRISFMYPIGYGDPSSSNGQIILRINAFHSLWIKESEKTFDDYVNEKDSEGIDAVVIDRETIVNGYRIKHGRRPGMGDPVFIVVESLRNKRVIEFEVTAFDDGEIVQKMLERIAYSCEFFENGITNKLSLDYSMLADSEWTHYEDGDLRISFMYPIGYGDPSSSNGQIILRINAFHSLWIKESEKTFDDYVNEKDSEGIDAVVIDRETIVNGYRIKHGRRPGMGDPVFIVVESLRNKRVIEFEVTAFDDGEIVQKMLERIAYSCEFFDDLF